MNEKLYEGDVVALLEEFLSASAGVDAVTVDPKFGHGLRPDLVVRNRDGTTHIVEVKIQAPMSLAALQRVIGRLQEYASMLKASTGREPVLVLVVPTQELSPQRIDELALHNIELWDRTYLKARIPERLVPTLGERAALAWRLLFGEASDDDNSGPSLNPFEGRLEGIPCGKSQWSAYQKLCADLLTYLFCPPLKLPLYEDANESGVNRRDILLPNYASGGFWAFMHRSYRAEYVVVDAKNSCKKVKKPDVLQLANYLSEAGTGMFGMIFTRLGEAESARITRREQWLIHRKMIITISDEDIEQMLVSKATGSAPEDVIRQKLQDFRLAI